MIKKSFPSFLQILKMCSLKPNWQSFECKFWISRSTITHVKTVRLDLKGLDLEKMTSFPH